MQEAEKVQSTTPGVTHAARHDLRTLFAAVTFATHRLEDYPTRVRRLGLMQAIEAAAMADGNLAARPTTRRGDARAPRRFDLNDQIMALEPIIRALVPTISFDLCDAFLPVRMARDALEAMIFERLANARASAAGAIIIRTRRLRKRAVMMIADDGREMDGRTLASIRHVADTHAARATGFVRVGALAKRAHGHFQLRSRLGAGTVAIVTIPLVLAMAPPHPDAPIRRRHSSATPKPHGPET